MTAPTPPPNLASRKPQLLELPAGKVLNRFYTAAYDPVFFDPGPWGRLNAPDGSYGVLYVAEAPDGAFAETFLRQPGRQLIPADLLAKKSFVRLRCDSELRLIRLTGTGLASIGATAEVTHGGLPYDVPRAWSAALRAHPSAPDGIAYTARHDDSQICYAIFEHAKTKIGEIDRILDLDSDWFWTMAETYDVGRAPD